MLIEGKTVELKREYVDDIKKTAAAFANCDGGTVYIGIDDDGSVCGVPDADATMLRVTNALRGSLEANLAKANPSMGDKVKKGLCAPTEVLFLQPETYLLYRDLLLMKGYSVGQLKPVNVISNEMQRKFFFGLQEDFDELKRK